VPSSPVNLTAVVSGSSVTLSWGATRREVLLGYRIEAGTAAGLSNIASSVIGNTSSFAATNVPPGLYFVRVRAVAADGESAPSNEVSFVVGGGSGGGAVCSSPPNAPLLVGVVNGTVVTFRFVSIGGCAPTNYVLFAGSAPGSSNVAIVNIGNHAELSASAPPGTYYVRVIAQNSFGMSGPSNEVTLTVLNAPPPPPPGGVGK